MRLNTATSACSPANGTSTVFRARGKCWLPVLHGSLHAFTPLDGAGGGEIIWPMLLCLVNGKWWTPNLTCEEEEAAEGKQQSILLVVCWALCARMLG